MLYLPWTTRKVQQGRESPRNTCTQAKPSTGKHWLQGLCLFQNALALALTLKNTPQIPLYSPHWRL